MPRGQYKRFSWLSRVKDGKVKPIIKPEIKEVNYDGCLYIFRPDYFFYEKRIREYLPRWQRYSFYKVGYSEDPEKRLIGVNTNCPFPLFLFRTFYCCNAMLLKVYIHKVFLKNNINREWFKLTDKELKEMVRLLKKVSKFRMGKIMEEIKKLEVNYE